MISLLRIPAIRSFAWRLGRRLYRWARREVSGRYERRGECWLLRNVLVSADRNQTAILLDIGAHKGAWSDNAFSLMHQLDISFHMHAFEPSASSFSFLTEKYKGCNFVSMHRIALSDCSGEGEFFVVGELAGTNSLFRSDGAIVESVRTLRIDDFLNTNQIEHALFVKSDTEGNDLAVLRGATEALRKGRIDVWQFEYNHRWIAGRSFLKDVFDLIADKPYRIGRLYKNGIETYESWHPELDRFFESNYVLIRKGSIYERFCSPVHFDYRNVLRPN